MFWRTVCVTAGLVVMGLGVRAFADGQAGQGLAFMVAGVTVVGSGILAGRR